MTLSVGATLITDCHYSLTLAVFGWRGWRALPNLAIDDKSIPVANAITTIFDISSILIAIINIETSQSWLTPTT